MPTADYKLSGVHTADTQSLKDCLESVSAYSILLPHLIPPSFPEMLVENITGAGSSGPSGRRATQPYLGPTRTGGDLSESYSRLPHDPRVALHYPSPGTVRQRAPAFDRRSSMLEQPPLFMRLIAAYKALVDGKVPTNEQLEDMMDAVAKAKNIRGVSGDGMECLRALDGLLKRFHVKDVYPRQGARVKHGSEIQKLDEDFERVVPRTNFCGARGGEEPGKAFAEVLGRVRGDVKGYLKGARKWEAEEEEEGEEQAEEYGGEEEEEEDQEVPLRSSRRKGATAGRQAYISFFFSVLTHPDQKKTVEAPQPSKSKSKQMVPGAETSPSSTMSRPAAMDAPRRPHAKASQKRSGYKTEGRQKEAKLPPSEAQASGESFLSNSRSL
ncbi:hypothetical protein BC829DRAFT_478112 [Chytridium lagenaria]|nr:hypothetical protein BC829DRAFT_478112 [Chytridium lagenaria]